MDKSSCDVISQMPQNSEHENEEIQPTSESLLNGGSTPRDDLDLVERVQSLTKENEELKGVLLQNNKRLEDYFKELASMQRNQKQTNETLRKGYDHAKVVVKQLRDNNASLKTELKNEQDKNQHLEEQMVKMKNGILTESSSQPDCKVSSPNQVESLQEVIKRLEIEKVTLETNNCKLQEHISCLKSLRDAEQNFEGEDCDTLISFGSVPLPSDQVSLETLQEKYKKLETDKEILQVDLQKMTIESQQNQQRFCQMEEDHDQLLKKLADVEQRLQDDTEAKSDQMLNLSEELQEQTEAVDRLREELDAVSQEREVYKKKVEELELAKESARTEQAASQTDHEETREVTESGVLTQQPENDDVMKLKEELLILTRERDTYKKKLDDFQGHLEAAKESAKDAFGDVEDTEMKEKYVKLKQDILLYQKREAEVLARENTLYREREEAQKKEAAEKEEIERLQQLLQNFEMKERDQLEAANKQLASQAELEKKINRLNEQIEADKTEFRKQFIQLTQEKEMYKMKAEEFQTQAADEAKASAEEVLATGGEADLKERLKKVRDQLLKYQQRENILQDRENAVLEKEEAIKELLKENENLRRQLAEALLKEETLAQEKQKQETESQTLNRQLSENHEQEVLLLKEELRNKDEAITAVHSSEENLKTQVVKLLQENQNLVIECEKCKAESTKKEEEAQSVKRQLSETHEQEVLLLKEELQNKHSAITSAQTNEEHLKAQVTQLIQENETLNIELERLKEDIQQQENMYQEHLHKVTQDSEHQRQRRDDIIKNLKTQLSSTEGEMQKSRAKHDTEKKTFLDLQSQHEGLIAQFQELLQNYDTIMNNAKDQEKEKSDLQLHLNDSECHRQKLKEDIGLKEGEIANLRERVFQQGNLQEQFSVQKTQLEVYRADFQVEREAREKQHEEILRLREQIHQLQQENQHYQDEMDRLGNSSMAEMQRRHGSFVPEQQDPQQPRGWFDMFPAGLFARGGSEMPEGLRNPQGHMHGGQQFPGLEQTGSGLQVHQTGGVAEEDWECPHCRRTFADFDNLQIHAVACSGAQPPPDHQCPKCMNVFPDYDTLAIHVEECLERD